MKHFKKPLLLVMAFGSVIGLTGCSDLSVNKDLKEYADSQIITEKNSKHLKLHKKEYFAINDYVYSKESSDDPSEVEYFSILSDKKIPDYRKISTEETDFILGEEYMYDVFGDQICEGRYIENISIKDYFCPLDSPYLPSAYRTGAPEFGFFNVAEIEINDSRIYILKSDEDTHFSADGLLTKSDLENGFRRKNYDGYEFTTPTFIMNRVDEDTKSTYLDLSYFRYDASVDNHIFGDYKHVEKDDCDEYCDRVLLYPFTNCNVYRLSIREVTEITNNYSFYKDGHRYMVYENGEESPNIGYFPVSIIDTKDRKTMFMICNKIEKDKTLSNKFYIMEVNEDLKKSNLTDDLSEYQRLGNEYKFNDKTVKLGEKETLLSLSDTYSLVAKELDLSVVFECSNGEKHDFYGYATGVSSYIVEDAIAAIRFHEGIFETNELIIFNTLTGEFKKHEHYYKLHDVSIACYVFSRTLYVGSTLVEELDEDSKDRYSFSSDFSKKKVVCKNNEYFICNLKVLNSKGIYEGLGTTFVLSNV